MNSPLRTVLAGATIIGHVYDDQNRALCRCRCGCGSEFTRTYHALSRAEVRGETMTCIECKAKREVLRARERYAKRGHCPQSLVEDLRGVSKARLEEMRRDGDDRPGDLTRPRTRAECADVPRPCPFVSCSHNLYLDVTVTSRNIKFNFPDREPSEMSPDASCALDVADDGGATLEDVGQFMNLTRERVRQLEERALKKLRLKTETGDL